MNLLDIELFMENYPIITTVLERIQRLIGSDSTTEILECISDCGCLYMICDDFNELALTCLHMYDEDNDFWQPMPSYGLFLLPIVGDCRVSHEFIYSVNAKGIVSQSKTISNAKLNYGLDNHCKLDFYYHSRIENFPKLLGLKWDSEFTDMHFKTNIF